MTRMVIVMYWCFKMPDQVGHDDNVIAGLTVVVIAGLTGNLKSRI